MIPKTDPALEELVARMGQSWNPNKGLPGLAGAKDAVMTTQGAPVDSAGVSPQAMGAAPTTDWANVAGAGIGAAGATVGTLAQLAGQKAAWDQQQNQANLNLNLSQKLAKMQLGQQQKQFDVTQAFKALEWALDANNAKMKTGNAGRDLRRSEEELLGAALRRLYL